jgi:hypothetical protein
LGSITLTVLPRLHTQRAQRGGQPGAALARLRPGVAARAVHHGRQVGKDFGAALDKTHRRQRGKVGGVAIQVLVVDAHGSRRGGEAAMLAVACRCRHK